MKIVVALFQILGAKKNLTIEGQSSVNLVVFRGCEPFCVFVSARPWLWWSIWSRRVQSGSPSNAERTYTRSRPSRISSTSTGTAKTRYVNAPPLARSVWIANCKVSSEEVSLCCGVQSMLESNVLWCKPQPRRLQNSGTARTVWQRPLAMPYQSSSTGFLRVLKVNKKWCS